jgi:hypothetical protein
MQDKLPGVLKYFFHPCSELYQMGNGIRNGVLKKIYKKKKESGIIFAYTEREKCLKQ